MPQGHVSILLTLGITHTSVQYVKMYVCVPVTMAESVCGFVHLLFLILSLFPVWLTNWYRQSSHGIC